MDQGVDGKTQLKGPEFYAERRGTGPIGHEDSCVMRGWWWLFFF
jgi:hypothetical protein